MKTPKTYKMELFIVHPGIQHAPRLANAAVYSHLFSKVTLLTSVLFKEKDYTPHFFRKRKKLIDSDVKIVNHYIYTFCYELSKFIYNKIIYAPNTQAHNNPIYFWQQVFGYICLPRLWFNRKNTFIICFETAGHPVAKYCKKWKIPVIMDFASISHEKAKELGINETEYGIKLKIKERQYIDYAFFCSRFCEESFKGKTSAKKDFVMYLGADGVGKSMTDLDQGTENKDEGKIEVKDFNSNKPLGVEKIKISFIANLEYRKGLDILLDAIYSYQYSAFLEIHLIGRIREEWVKSHKPQTINNPKVELVYKSPMSQQELFTYLAQEQFDLNVQPSRFDSFAMVVPETMMLGIPNIVSPYVGAGEMFFNPLKQLIMVNNSANSLYNCIIIYLKMNEFEKKQLYSLVLENAKEMTWNKYEQKVEKVLKKILEDLKIYKP